MEPIKARLISQGKGGRTAQVTVIMDEGRGKRSVTRHLHYLDGKWVGRNPDEAALARLDRAEYLLNEMERDHALHVAPLKDLTLDEIERQLTKLRRYRERARGVMPAVSKCVMALLIAGVDPSAQNIKKYLDELVEKKTAELNAARVKLDAIRKEVPREVEYTF